jgi:hypothetical protein
MKYYNYIIYNTILIIVVVLQIYYFLKNDPEILKEHIDSIVSLKGGSNLLKVISVLLLILLVIILFIISIFCSKKIGVNKYVTFSLLIITIVNYVDSRIKTNTSFSNVEGEIDKTLEESNTGDFVLFRSYHSYDIPEFFFYRMLNSMYSKILFGHIGMIVKHQNETYIVENADDKHFCLYHKYKKNGPIIHNAKDRIKNYSGRVYLSKNNLHEFVKESHVYSTLKKCKHYIFLQNGKSCVSLICDILSDAGLMNRPLTYYMPCDFIDTRNYKINYNQIENIKIRNDFIVGTIPERGT